MTVSTLATTGTRKAAIVLLQLGREAAAAVLSRLEESEIEAISAEIARLQNVSAEEGAAVLGEFHGLATGQGVQQGGIGFASQLLAESVGDERAAQIVGRINAASVQAPFRALQHVEPAQLRSFIIDEHPQVVALVLAHLPAERSSAVLAGMPPAAQAEVAHRIAVMDRTSPEVVRTVERTLERRLSAMLQPVETSRVGGVAPLVDIINRSDRSTERQIVEGLASLDPALADEVRSRMFMFEDIVHIEDRGLQLVLRQVDPAQLALALKGVTPEVRDKIASNLSERAASDLLEEVEILGAVRLAQVEEAQQGVLHVIRELEEQGQVTVRRGGDDDFVV
ncbi:flagellar motor switch protein FliG [Nocardioides scoriae]|uniref:Flagellar motor switch protein FliG n=1 Tax=Nocardioides scoriae TaxID=642780 RepID=A0A1H1S677_9ACTN|nr:flagellar motor switch protein FliG [Nocardioides scoriae]SDS43497.1 flagellar motor switch protein FliG [Nocardioides scoriae]